MSGSATRFDEEAPPSAEIGENDVAGTQLGNYELLQRLPAGGMAEVFIARRIGAEAGDVVALKRILPHLARNQRFVRMFLDEARLAAQLDHANIVSVVDIGRSGNDYYFTMEYLHGENLHRVLARSVKTGIGIPLEQAVFIIVHLCMALHYAHELTDPEGNPLNIVHRDVSPTNIMLTYEGAVKILDFGVAKAATQTQITKTGVTKGKASYMSPEQCQGKHVDRRSDVFALGILLYEMTTLRPLFRAENDLLVMQDIVSKDAAPPSSVVPNYPRDLEAIVMRALAREPSHRYPTAMEFEQDLGRFARLNNLSSSTEDFSEFVRRLFGSKPHPWRSPKVVVTNSELPVYDPKKAEAARVATRGPAIAPGILNQAAPPVGMQSGGAAPMAPTATEPPPPGPTPPEGMAVSAGFEPGRANAGNKWIGVAAAAAIVAVGGAFAYVLATPSPSPAPATTGDASQGTVPPTKETPPPPPAASAGQESGAEPPPEPPPDETAGAVVEEDPLCPPDMLYVAGGVYTMGTEDRVLTTSAPPHRVEVAPFCMSTHEITDVAFLECSSVGECKRAYSTSTPEHNDTREVQVSDKLCNARKPGKEKHPVNCVTWEQANMFCAWKKATLPTEVQWEFAARGADGRTFVWGEEAPMAHRLNACGQECLRWRSAQGLREVNALFNADDDYFGTAPVGSFPSGATPEGIQDLAGNVLEWTADPFKPYPGGAEPRKLPRDAKILRGGSFMSTDLPWVTGAARHTRSAAGAYVDVGFRCVAPPK